MGGSSGAEGSGGLAIRGRRCAGPSVVLLGRKWFLSGIGMAISLVRRGGRLG